MRENKYWLLSMAMAMVFLLSGCALVVGGVIAGAGTGSYYYVNGDLQAEYSAPFDKVWAACEKTLADMRAVNVQPYKEIGSGRISAVINDEKVKFAIQYKAKNSTTVAIRVGPLGNKIAAQMLNDKVGDNLK